MPGYKPMGKIYDLAFEDHPGLEVRCKGASLGELNKVRELEPNMNEPDEKKRLAVFGFFEKKVISWNIVHPEVSEPSEIDEKVCARCALKEDDELPISVHHMQCLELSFIMQIIIGWVFAVARVSIPKDMNLSNGAPIGQGSPLPDGLVKAITTQLENLQNPSKLPELSFTSD
jgi:hypothetical protein